MATVVNGAGVTVVNVSDADMIDTLNIACDAIEVTPDVLRPEDVIDDNGRVMEGKLHDIMHLWSQRRKAQLVLTLMIDGLDRNA